MAVENKLVDGERRLSLILVAGFVFARLVSLLLMSLDGLRGYGDFPTFFQVSSLPGWPYINYWVEFPPIFPFLNALLHRLSGGQEHVFDYLLFFILLAADAGNLFLFSRLVRWLHPLGSYWVRLGAYLLLLVTLAYSWWYFDSLAVFLMLLGLVILLKGHSLRGGAALGLGIATKFFPGLVLLVGWRRWSWKRLLVTASLSLAPLMILYGLLWRASPDFTGASIRSQGSKGSWETVWALLDGNLRTGNFGPLEDRLHPARALQLVGNPPVIPPLASLVIFAGLGLVGLLTTWPKNDRQSLALVGFAMSLLFLWSPGWSPQWCLFLLPIILLVLPESQAVLLSVVFTLTNLLEWPVLLSRGFFEMLWIPVLVRTLLLALMAGLFWAQSREVVVKNTVESDSLRG